MTHVTCRLTAKNRDQLRNPTLGNRVWATFTFYRTKLHVEVDGKTVVEKARKSSGALRLIVCVFEMSEPVRTIFVKLRFRLRQPY